jgi:hypothetical protein
LGFSESINRELRSQGTSLLQNIMIEMNLQSLEPGRIIEQSLD